MRIRQVKPEFFKDARLAALSPAVRLFYIGLWMVADDGGWLRADVPELGIELFGYDPRKSRERTVTCHLDALRESGRIVMYPCGHAFIPTFTNHQRLAGETRRVHTVKREHEACPHIPATPRTSPQVPDTVRNVGGNVKGTVSNGSVDAPANTPDGAGATELSEWRKRVPRPA
jgi:hypothetical protein